MGLDARRGADFPPELYDDILRGGKTKSNEADKPLVQAAGERLGDIRATCTRQGSNLQPLAPEANALSN